MGGNSNRKFALGGSMGAGYPGNWNNEVIGDSLMNQVVISGL